jgi:hypothetical protein
MLCQSGAQGEDRPAKRLGIEDTSSDSSGSEGLGDEYHTLWLLRYVTTLRESRAPRYGAQHKFVVH